MAAEPANGLKGATSAPDTTEVPQAIRRSSKLVLVAVAVLVIGAAVAGATVAGVDIGDPLALHQEGGVVTQVLPTPTTSAPAASSGADSAVAMTTAALTAALRADAPGTAHEGTPHGVPAGYDWAARAVSHGTTPPTPESRFVNLWGQVYVDRTNVRPANTRVAIAGCELWRLGPGSATWQRVQGGPTSRIEGGAWSEDFTRTGGQFSLRDEPDGSQSTITYDGYNSHIWTRDPLVDAGTDSRAFLVACSTRLVLADPTGVDDRAQSTYLVSVGADWRLRDYGCPSYGGTVVCGSIGLGRMVRAGTAWRRVLMTTADLGAGTLPLPPVEALRNPDGTYGSR